MPGSWTIHVRTGTGASQRFGCAKLTASLCAALGDADQPLHITAGLADAVVLFLRRRRCRMVTTGALREMCLAALHGVGLDAAAEAMQRGALPMPHDPPTPRGAPPRMAPAVATA